METTIMSYIGIIGYILGLYLDHGLGDAKTKLGKSSSGWHLARARASARDQAD